MHDINSVYGNDVLVNEIAKLSQEQTIDKDILIPSSIEGEHKDKIISEYAILFSVCSWRELLAGNKPVNNYISNNFLKWVNEGVFNN